MTDIVERLRDAANQKFTQDGQVFQLTFCGEAADEIEKLREERNRLREALADIANIINPYEDGDTMQEIARDALKEKE